MANTGRRDREREGLNTENISTPVSWHYEVSVSEHTLVKSPCEEETLQNVHTLPETRETIFTTVIKLNYQLNIIVRG